MRIGHQDFLGIKKNIGIPAVKNKVCNLTQDRLGKKLVTSSRSKFKARFPLQWEPMQVFPYLAGSRSTKSLRKQPDAEESGQYRWKRSAGWAPWRVCRLVAVRITWRSDRSAANRWWRCRAVRRRIWGPRFRPPSSTEENQKRNSRHKIIFSGCLY